MHHEVCSISCYSLFSAWVVAKHISLALQLEQEIGLVILILFSESESQVLTAVLLHVVGFVSFYARTKCNIALWNLLKHVPIFTVRLRSQSLAWQVLNISYGKQKYITYLIVSPWHYLQLLDSNEIGDVFSFSILLNYRHVLLFQWNSVAHCRDCWYYECFSLCLLSILFLRLQRITRHLILG